MSYWLWVVFALGVAMKTALTFVGLTEWSGGDDGLIFTSILIWIVSHERRR